MYLTIRFVGGMCLVSTIVVYHLCYRLLFLMLDIYGLGAMILDLNILCFIEYIHVLDHIYSLYAPIIVPNWRPQGDRLGYQREKTII